MTVQLNPNEVVVKASDSKHFNGPLAICGKLILTNQRLFFTTNGTETQDISIWPAGIREILHFSTGLFSNNGLQVILKDGNELRFSVKDRDVWTRMINKMY